MYLEGHLSAGDRAVAASREPRRTGRACLPAAIQPGCRRSSVRSVERGASAGSASPQSAAASSPWQESTHLVDGKRRGTLSAAPTVELIRAANRNRRRATEAHCVVDACPVSPGTKEYLHLVVRFLGARGWGSLYASAPKQAEWLREDFARHGCASRVSRRGRSTGRKRRTLTRQSILNRMRAGVRAGLLKVTRRGRNTGRGWTYEIRPDGPLRDALRGAYKSWRGCFEVPGEDGDEPRALPAPSTGTTAEHLKTAVQAAVSNMLEQRGGVLPQDGRNPPAADRDQLAAPASGVEPARGIGTRSPHLERAPRSDAWSAADGAAFLAKLARGAPCAGDA